MNVCIDSVIVRFYFGFYIFLIVTELLSDPFFTTSLTFSQFFCIFFQDCLYLIKKDIQRALSKRCISTYSWKHDTQWPNYFIKFVADKILKTFFTTIKFVSYVTLLTSTSCISVGLLEKWNFRFSISTSSNFKGSLSVL